MRQSKGSINISLLAIIKHNKSIPYIGIILGSFSISHMFSPNLYHDIVLFIKVFSPTLNDTIHYTREYVLRLYISSNTGSSLLYKLEECMTYQYYMNSK